MEENKREWVNHNACRFCKGSRGHTCYGYDCREAARAAGEYFESLKERLEPRFLLEKVSPCYGCPQYRHWTKTNDPYYFEECDMDQNGGVCDAEERCFEGNRNTYQEK